MRVVLVTYSTKPRGGVVHTLALAEALAAAGADVCVVTLGRGGDSGFFRPVSAAVEVVVVPFPDRAGEGVGARVLRSIAVLGGALPSVRAGADVVHAQDCISANAAGPAAVRTVHHLDAFRTPELVACHDRAVRAPVALVCVSQAVATAVRDRYGRTATVIANGVAGQRFAAAGRDADTARRYAAARGQPPTLPAVLARAGLRSAAAGYLLTVGGVEPRKGTAELLAAHHLLGRRPGRPALVIAGGETLFDYRRYREVVLRRAAALGVHPVLLGPVADDALPALVAGARVFAFPSVHEGFGLAPLEAMAAGVPVVARPTAVAREVLGGHARYASGPAALAAAVRAALAADPDAPASRAAAAAAAAHAAGYRWADAAARHLALYAALPRPGAHRGRGGRPHGRGAGPGSGPASGPASGPGVGAPAAERSTAGALPRGGQRLAPPARAT